WRRVPSRFRLVQAAFTAILINSTVLRGSTPLVQGLVVICTHVSAQPGSHSKSCSNAESHGPLALPEIETGLSLPAVKVISVSSLLSPNSYPFRFCVGHSNLDLSSNLLLLFQIKMDKLFHLFSRQFSLRRIRDAKGEIVDHALIEI